MGRRMVIHPPHKYPEVRKDRLHIKMKGSVGVSDATCAAVLLKTHSYVFQWLVRTRVSIHSCKALGPPSRLGSNPARARKMNDRIYNPETRIWVGEW